MTTRGFYSNKTYCYRATIKDVINRSTVVLDVDLGFNISKPNQRYRVMKINNHVYKSKAISSVTKVLRYIRTGDEVIIKSEHLGNKKYCEIFTDDSNPFLYHYKATMGKIVDGDTVDAIMDLGFSIIYKERFRFYGINAWETRGSERDKGLIAKARVMELAPTGSSIIVQTFKDAKGKYGRYLADIQIPDNCKTVNQILLEEGHARVYV
jgi:micrococcal nuclease